MAAINAVKIFSGSASNYLAKDIETYGVLRITELGLKFLENPHSFLMTEDHDYDEDTDDSIITNNKSGGSVADEVLMNYLKELRKKIYYNK